MTTRLKNPKFYTRLSGNPHTPAFVQLLTIASTSTYLTSQEKRLDSLNMQSLVLEGGMA